MNLLKGNIKPIYLKYLSAAFGSAMIMKPTEAILKIEPAMIRCYSISFILLPMNIFSTYYFQVLMKPRAAFYVSVFRGCIVSGILIMLLPIVAEADSIWFAMPITELLVAVYAVFMMNKYTKALSKDSL